MKYWLVKSEPDVFSVDDLAECPNQTRWWKHVRNYQARNFMRDEMKVGDKVLFYHSNTKPPHVAGLARVASKPYPDPTQFDKKSKYFDPKATKEAPRWFLVDVAYVKKFKNIVSLNEIKIDPKLAGMPVAQRGQRLSIQPVSQRHFVYIQKLGGQK